MDIFDILKRFKNIEPDREFTRQSRRAILGNGPTARGLGFVLRNLELGAALALTVLALFILGGAPWREISPLGVAGLDTAGLKAEAQAVDMQIELSNLRYAESTRSTVNPPVITPAALANQTTTAETAAPEATTTAAGFQTTMPGQGPAASSTAASSTSIDDALRSLAE